MSGQDTSIEKHCGSTDFSKTPRDTHTLEHQIHQLRKTIEDMASKQASVASNGSHGPPKTIEHGYNTFLTSVRVNNRRTAALYENRLATFREFLIARGSDLAEITPELFQDWRESRTANGFKVLVDIKILRCFYNWLFVEHYLEENKLRFVKMKQFNKEKTARVTRQMSDKEVRKLLRAAQKFDSKIYVFVLLLCYAGLRIAEACQMRCDDIKRARVAAVQDADSESSSESDDTNSDSDTRSEYESDSDEVDSPELYELQKLYRDFVKPLPNKYKHDKKWIMAKLREKAVSNVALHTAMERSGLMCSTQALECEFTVTVRAANSKNSESRTRKLHPEVGAVVYEYVQDQITSGKTMMFPAGSNAHTRAPFWYYYDEIKSGLRFEKPGESHGALTTIARDRWATLSDYGKYKQRAAHYNQRLNNLTVSTSGARAWFYKARDAAKLRDCITPHWCRHWFCTSQLKNGVPLKNVSKSMGHKNIAVTDTYAHDDDAENGSAALPFGKSKKRKSKHKKSKHYVPKPDASKKSRHH